MQQIAAMAGVSVTTVSHVLSGNRPVNARTAERVRAIINQYSYVPDSAARRLKSGHSGLIGFIVPDLTISYFSGVANGIETGADLREYGVIVSSTSSLTSERRMRFLDLLRDATLDGIVYVPDAAAVDAQVLAIATQYPVVLADELLSGSSDLASVTCDNAAGGRAVGEHLASLGHRRALIIGGPESLIASPRRVAGVKEAFPQALVLTGTFTAEAGYRLVDEALSNGLEFTCVAAANDDQALGALRRLREEGLSVPGDCSVVGFDDIPVAAYAGLTTIRQPAVEIGRAAADLLIEKIRNPLDIPSPPPQILLDVELVVRETTGPVPVGRG